MDHFYQIERMKQNIDPPVAHSLMTGFPSTSPPASHSPVVELAEIGSLADLYLVANL